MFLKKMLKAIKLKKMSHNFSKKNRNNDVRFIEFNTLDNVVVGDHSYGRISLFDFNDGGKLKIGSYCSFGKNVFICLGGEHNYKLFSTFPFSTRLLKKGITSKSKGNIIIENDVWIGVNVTILSGTTIGRGAIVAAGAVVANDLEPYGIYGGVPAKLIKYRFSKPVRDYLMSKDFNDLTIDKIKSKISFLETEITDDNYKDIIDEIFK